MNKTRTVDSVRQDHEHRKRSGIIKLIGLALHGSEGAEVIVEQVEQMADDIDVLLREVDRKAALLRDLQ